MLYDLARPDKTQASVKGQSFLGRDEVADALPRRFQRFSHQLSSSPRPLAASTITMLIVAASSPYGRCHNAFFFQSDNLLTDRLDQLPILAAMQRPDTSTAPSRWFLQMSTVNQQRQQFLPAGSHVPRVFAILHRPHRIFCRGMAERSR
jgi:hypothetical protein